MKNKTMSIIVVLVISLLFVMACEVRATSDNPITLNLTTGDTTANITTNVVENNIVENTNTNSNTEVANNTQVIQPNTNKTATTTDKGNTLPQTGVTEDITVMFFIIVCAVSAIYAYKKIRDYRV